MSCPEKRVITVCADSTIDIIVSLYKKSGVYKINLNIKLLPHPRNHCLHLLSGTALGSFPCPRSALQSISPSLPGTLSWRLPLPLIGREWVFLSAICPSPAQLCSCSLSPLHVLLVIYLSIYINIVKHLSQLKCLSHSLQLFVERS